MTSSSYVETACPSSALACSIRVSQRLSFLSATANGCWFDFAKGTNAVFRMTRLEGIEGSGDMFGKEIDNDFCWREVGQEERTSSRDRFVASHTCVAKGAQISQSLGRKATSLSDESQYMS